MSLYKCFIINLGIGQLTQWMVVEVAEHWAVVHFVSRRVSTLPHHRTLQSVPTHDAKHGMTHTPAHRLAANHPAPTHTCCFACVDATSGRPRRTFRQRTVLPFDLSQGLSTSVYTSPFVSESTSASLPWRSQLLSVTPGAQFAHKMPVCMTHAHNQYPSMSYHTAPHLLLYMHADLHPLLSCQVCHHIRGLLRCKNSRPSICTCLHSWSTWVL